MKKILSVFALLTFTVCAFSQSVKSLGFSPNHIKPNGNAKYVIEVENADINISLDDLPLPSGLVCVGQQRGNRYSFGTGQKTSNVNIYTFTLSAANEGDYEIKAWKVKDASNTFDIPAATLKVSKNAPQYLQHSSNDPFDEFDRMTSAMRGRTPSRQNQPAETIDLNKEISITTSPEKDKIYVGENLKCKITIVFSDKLAQYGFQPNAMPAVRMADSDVFKFALDSKEAQVSRLPNSGVVVINYSAILTAQKAGTHKAEFEVEGSIAQNDFFARTHHFKLNSKAEDYAVLDLPTPPKNFSNGIGNFVIESASIDTPALTVGEPCKLSIKISGEGNFDRVSAPELSSSGDWKTYAPKVNFQDHSNGLATKGVKTFDYTIVPTKPDIELVPNFEFVFFNTEKNEYETLKTSEIKVSVAPSKSFAKRQQEASEKPDELGKIAELAQNKNGGILSSRWFWLSQIILLCLVFAAGIFALKKRSQNSDPNYIRLKNARKKMAQSLNAAKYAAQKNDAKNFFTPAVLAVQNALCPLSAMDANAITLGDAQRILKDISQEKELSEKVKIIFEGADAIAFGGYTPQAQELNKLYSDLESICKKLS